MEHRAISRSIVTIVLPLSRIHRTSLKLCSETGPGSVFDVKTSPAQTPSPCPSVHRFFTLFPLPAVTRPTVSMNLQLSLIHHCVHTCRRAPACSQSRISPRKYYARPHTATSISVLAEVGQSRKKEREREYSVSRLNREPREFLSPLSRKIGVRITP